MYPSDLLQSRSDRSATTESVVSIFIAGFGKLRISSRAVYAVQAFHRLHKSRGLHGLRGPHKTHGLLKPYGLRGSGGFRTHKRRVKAAPRALLRKCAKRARRQSFAYPTRTRTRSFRPLKVCRSIRTPRRARLMRACGAHCGAAVRLRYGAAIMTASPRTSVRGLAYVCGRGAVCAAPF